jgi:hypothetical protein
MFWKKEIEKTSYNERFHASGGVCPQKKLWSYCNIVLRRSVSGMPLLLQSRFSVISNAGQCLKWIENFAFVDIKKNV